MGAAADGPWPCSPPPETVSRFAQAFERRWPLLLGGFGAGHFEEGEDFGGGELFGFAGFEDGDGLGELGGLHGDAGAREEFAAAFFDALLLEAIGEHPLEGEEAFFAGEFRAGFADDLEGFAGLEIAAGGEGFFDEGAVFALLDAAAELGGEADEG